MDAGRQLWLENRLKNTNNCFPFKLEQKQAFSTRNNVLEVLLF